MTPDEPEGRVVVITPLAAGGYRVTLAPPLPSGDEARTFYNRDDAFARARVLWTRHRCGFRDLTEGRGEKSG